MADDDDVQRERDTQVRPVRHGPDRPDERPVEDHQRRAQMLVVRREDPLQRQVAEQQERELVVVEGHVATEPDEDRQRPEREEHRRPTDRRERPRDGGRARVGGRRVAWFGLGGHEHGVYGSRRESLAARMTPPGQEPVARQEL